MGVENIKKSVCETPVDIRIGETSRECPVSAVLTRGRRES